MLHEMSHFLQFGVPRPASDGKHKMEVWVWDHEAGQPLLVRFGSVDYEDFRQHGDWARRASYLRRSAGIRDGRGRLTAGDPRSGTFWSRRVLWLSAEPMVDVRPPPGTVWYR